MVIMIRTAKTKLAILAKSSSVEVVQTYSALRKRTSSLGYMNTSMNHQNSIITTDGNLARLIFLDI